MTTLTQYRLWKLDTSLNDAHGSDIAKIGNSGPQTVTASDSKGGGTIGPLEGDGINGSEVVQVNIKSEGVSMTINGNTHKGQMVFWSTQDGSTYMGFTPYENAAQYAKDIEANGKITSLTLPSNDINTGTGDSSRSVSPTGYQIGNPATAAAPCFTRGTLIATSSGSSAARAAARTLNSITLVVSEPDLKGVERWQWFVVQCLCHRDGGSHAVEPYRSRSA